MSSQGLAKNNSKKPLSFTTTRDPLKTIDSDTTEEGNDGLRPGSNDYLTGGLRTPNTGMSTIPTPESFSFEQVNALLKAHTENLITKLVEAGAFAPSSKADGTQRSATRALGTVEYKDSELFNGYNMTTFIEDLELRLAKKKISSAKDKCITLISAVEIDRRAWIKEYAAFKANDWESLREAVIERYKN